MRIGITGSQSVGKTTLLNALRSEPVFKDYSICNEVTRRVKSYGLPINENGTDNTQRLIMHEHVINIFLHEKMLTDRTALDCLVYTTYLVHTGKVSMQTLDYIINLYDKIIHQYDILFYIRPEFDIEDDGVRSVDSEFRDTIANLFDVAIKTTPNVHIITGTVRERVNQVISTLQLNGMENNDR